MQAGNPFLDENFVANSGQPTPGPVPMLCAAEYQHHPHLFRLPASSPFDNFLKAAGCWVSWSVKTQFGGLDEKKINTQVSSLVLNSMAWLPIPAMGIQSISLLTLQPVIAS